jgi:hypothetical protein
VIIDFIHGSGLGFLMSFVSTVPGPSLRVVILASASQAYPQVLHRRRNYKTEGLNDSF